MNKKPVALLLRVVSVAVVGEMTGTFSKPEAKS